MSDTADQWYRCPIERKALKGLMRRSDRHGLAKLAAYVAFLVACGWPADRSSTVGGRRPEPLPV